MKNIIPSLLAGAMMVFASAASADCSLNMPEERLIECLTVEGSGENYQDYQRELEEEYADMAEEAAKEAKVVEGADSRMTASVR